jgi:stage II sporulation protein AA (anti-sigma F factor antagonist)
MAKNFRVSSKEKNDRSLCLKLYGDFDATSACELIDILKDRIRTCPKVSIDTDGLRSVMAFGLEVFRPEINRLGNPSTDILLTGRFKNAFYD